jgi:pilus assembly protein CpaE
LAVNLALSALKGVDEGDATRKVCLVDLSPASGQATLHLRVKAKKTWSTLPNMGTQPSVRDLASVLTPHSSGLLLLAAPLEPIFAGTLSAALVEGTLIGLASMFDLIIVDAPPLIDTVAATVMDSSHEILLVLTPEVGAIQATVATLQVLDDLEERVRLVLNHTSPQRGVPEQAIERALGRPLSARVPYDPAQVAALPQGKPLAWAKPSSPLAVATGQLLTL